MYGYFSGHFCSPQQFQSMFEAESITPSVQGHKKFCQCGNSIMVLLFVIFLHLTFIHTIGQKVCPARNLTYEKCNTNADCIKRDQTTVCVKEVRMNILKNCREEPIKESDNCFCQSSDANAYHCDKDTDCLDSCLLYTSPSPRDQRGSRMPSSA